MKKFEYSDELASVVDKCLEDEGLNRSFDDEGGVFLFSLSTDSPLRRINYLIGIQSDAIIVYGICPIGASRDDENMMARMAEFICRANYREQSGSFDFDFTDGEIRCKSFIDCEGVLPSDEVISNSIFFVNKMFDHYADGIAAIIFTGSSAEKAIEISDISWKARMRRLFESEERSDESETDAEIVIDDDEEDMPLRTNLFDEKKPGAMQ